MSLVLFIFLWDSKLLRFGDTLSRHFDCIFTQFLQDLLRLSSLVFEILLIWELRAKDRLWHLSWHGRRFFLYQRDRITSTVHRFRGLFPRYLLLLSELLRWENLFEPVRPHNFIVLRKRVKRWDTYQWRYLLLLTRRLFWIFAHFNQIWNFGIPQLGFWGFGVLLRYDETEWSHPRPQQALRKTATAGDSYRHYPVQAASVPCIFGLNDTSIPSWERIVVRLERRGLPSFESMS